MAVVLTFTSLLANEAPAQPSRFIVIGRVVEAGTSLPLPGAHVRTQGGADDSVTGSVTNDDGRFQLHVSSDIDALLVSSVGFDGRIIPLPDRPGERIDLGEIELTVSTIALSEVVVTPGRFSIMGAPIASMQTISERDIKNMSWAEDVTRVASRLPGISSSDFSSKFTIRGGEADEVLISLDGMELYEPFHQRDKAGGLFSIVDVEAVQGIDLMTGGFPADYGNRLSGVFAMRSRRPEQRRTTLGLSPMNARAFTEGTFSSGRGSYLASARRGMLDLLFKAVPDAELVPTFHDVLFKVDYQLNDRHTLSLHALEAGDRATVDDADELGNFDRNDTRYRNGYAWASLQSAITPKVVARSMVYAGLVRHNREGSFHKYEPSDKGDFSLRDEREYQFVGIKNDWQWGPSTAVAVSAGFDVRQAAADYRYVISQEELRVSPERELFTYTRNEDVALSPSGVQFGAYVSPRIRLGKRVVLEPGVRYDRTGYSGDEDVSPRLGGVLALSDRTHLRAAVGTYYQPQFVTSLDVNNGQREFNQSQKARHIVVGLEHRTNSGVNVRLEAYDKEMSRMSSYFTNLRDHQEIFPEQRNDNAEVVLDGARAQGVELFLKRDVGGKWSWWVSYALARAEDDVREIVFDGPLEKRIGWVPRLNDQRHTVYADLNYRPTNRWTFNFSFQYYRGWPRTGYTYDYLTLENGDYHFFPVEGEFNATPYPAFHRADVRVNRRFAVKRGEVTTFVHIINVYNRKNLRKFDLDTRDDDDNFSLDSEGNYVPFEDNLYWFGIVPAFGVAWTF